MRRSSIIISAVLACTLLFAGCTQEPKQASLELSKTEFLGLDFAGSDESLGITTASEWSITDAPSWIDVKPGSGKGDATVTLTVGVNGSDEGRSASLKVTAGKTTHTVLITQIGVQGERQIIPDRGFRTWLETQRFAKIIDNTGGEVVITDRGLAAKSMVPTHPSSANMIRSLEGLGFFPNLVKLDARNLGTISQIDLSGNTKLQEVYLTANGALTALDVSMLPELRLLQLAECNVQELDVTHNPELTYLSIDYNGIIELDVTQNTKLRQLYCTTSRRYERPGDISTPIVSSISALDVTNCPELTDLQCGGNPFITELDVTQNPKLQVLHTFGCSITEWHTSHNPELENLQVFFSPTLAKVDVTQNPKLVWFYIDETAVPSIDLSQNPLLGEFRCCDTAVSELDLSHNPKLVTLYAYGSKITELDLSHNPLLARVNMARTPLTTLDVSMLPDLVELNLHGTQIMTVDLKPNPRMELFAWTMADDLVGESLDISGCKQIRELQILSNRDNAIPGDDTFYLGATPNGQIYAKIKTIIADNTRLAGKLNVVNNPYLETLSMQNCTLSQAVLTGNSNLHDFYMNNTSAAGKATAITQSGNAADFQVVTTPRP